MTFELSDTARLEVLLGSSAREASAGATLGVRGGPGGNGGPGGRGAPGGTGGAPREPRRALNMVLAHLAAWCACPRPVLTFVIGSVLTLHLAAIDHHLHPFFALSYNPK